MKHIKRIITLVILSSFSLTAQAQSTKKADKHFAKYEFVEDRKGHDRRYTLDTDFEKPKITKTLFQYLKEQL